MSMQRILPVALVVAAVLFCLAAAMPAVKGQTFDPKFFILGGLFLLFAFVARRRSSAS